MKDCERALSQELIVVYALRLHTKILPCIPKKTALQLTKTVTRHNACEHLRARPARPSIFWGRRYFDGGRTA